MNFEPPDTGFPRRVDIRRSDSRGTEPRFLGVRIGAAIAVVADAASVGSDAGSIRHDGTFVDAPVLSEPPHRLLTSATSAAA